MTDYPERTGYVGPTAEEYDANRFTTLRGKAVGARELYLMGRAVRTLARGQKGPVTILDIPAGTGRLTSYLLNRGYVVAAADASADMLAVALDKYDLDSRPGFGGAIVCDGENLPFDDDAFDIVVCLRLMGHLPPDVRERVLGEAMRVSRLGAAVGFEMDTMVTRTRQVLSTRLRRKGRGTSRGAITRTEFDSITAAKGWCSSWQRDLLPVVSVTSVKTIVPAENCGCSDKGDASS